jgi:cell division protein FtsL
MIRTNFILMALLIICALSLVTSQHKTRRMVTQYEHEVARARALDVEYGQLQLEQSTRALHANVERVAMEKLRLRSADTTRTIVLPDGERK